MSFLSYAQAMERRALIDEQLERDAERDDRRRREADAVAGDDE